MFSALEAAGRTLDAVRATVAYADIFAFAVSPAEIYRDLVGATATLDEVATAIQSGIQAGEFSVNRGYLTFVGRENLVQRRFRANGASPRLWSTARSYGTILASLPFVRLVGVTGSLAADNASADADIDYMLVVAPGRLWFVRALAIGTVRLARLRGVTLCPNYLLTTNALQSPHRDLYTAHELMQLVPLAGSETYAALRSANRWADEFLPNRSRVLHAIPPPGPRSAQLKRVAERAFGGSVGSRLDGWESQRKISRFRSADRRSSFSRDVCEGHFGHHRDRILHEWRDRCDRLGVTMPEFGGEPGSGELVASAGMPRYT